MTTTTPGSTKPSRPRPGAAVITTRPGGGSGEISVYWHAVPGATGYRVQRRTGRASSFAEIADFDITTGATTAADDVINIWSADHTYRPVIGPFVGADHSPWFEVVDYRFDNPRCYRVITYNAFGDGPASNTSCASLTGPLGPIDRPGPR